MGQAKTPIQNMIAMLSTELRKELASLYAELAEEQQTISASCHQCGRCCNFTAYDHQLWITNLELAYLFATEGMQRIVESDEQVCPYMTAHQCSARIGRTLGCRIFLCKQPALEMESLHEKYMNRLMTLAQKYHIDLEYSEFISSLHALSEKNET